MKRKPALKEKNYPGIFRHCNVAVSSCPSQGYCQTLGYKETSYYLLLRSYILVLGIKRNIKWSRSNSSTWEINDFISQQSWKMFEGHDKCIFTFYSACSSDYLINSCLVADVGV